MRRAACRCGRLSAECRGEPVRVSVCHCLACQRRTGSAFSVQARFPEEAVVITGEARAWRRVGDAGSTVEYGFCPECGSTVFYRVAEQPGLFAIPLGAFADPSFPGPRFSVYEERRHAWVEIVGDEVQHEP